MLLLLLASDLSELEPLTRVRTTEVRRVDVESENEMIQTINEFISIYIIIHYAVYIIICDTNWGCSKFNYYVSCGTTHTHTYKQKYKGGFTRCDSKHRFSHLYMYKHIFTSQLNRCTRTVSSLVRISACMLIGHIIIITPYKFIA